MPVDWTPYTPPPTPSASSDAGTWANYLAHVRIQDDRARFDAGQITSQASTDAQNARAAAEQAVAAAGLAQAQALQASAAALQAAEGVATGGITEATLIEVVKVVSARE